MSNIVFVGVLALLIIFTIHVALKLYLFEDGNVDVENLKFNNDYLNNNNNNNNNNRNDDSTRKNLWNELTNQPIQSHIPASYGPAPAKTEHAYQGMRGNFNGAVPNYPVLATENELHNLQDSLKTDLAGFLDEQSLNDHLLETNIDHNNYYSNMPIGGPVIGRPTKRPYKEIPVGVEKKTYDGQYKSYENVMYGTDIEKYHKNDSVNPHTNNGKHYAPFDKSPIISY